jgi:membrane protein required for colicin V production
MNFIDVLIIIPVIFGAYRGFKNGLVMEVFLLLALFVGLYVGINFSEFFSEKLKSWLGWDNQYLPIITFSLIFIAIGAMIYFLGITLDKLIKAVKLTLINKIFGSVFSTLKTLYFVSITLILISAYDKGGSFLPVTAKQGSLLYQPTIDFSTKTIPGLSGSNLVGALSLDSMTLENKVASDSLSVSTQDSLTKKKL